MKKLRQPFNTGDMFSFTLIELLVVISIIAILTSILLPALKRAMESGRTVSCANSTHQMQLTALSYSDDYNGWVLNGKPYSGYYWFSEIRTRLGKGIDFFKCPSERVGFGDYSEGFYAYTHYGVNINICGSTTFESKLHSVKTPSQSMYIMDSGRKNSYAMQYTGNVAFRHGRAHPVGNINISYFDGHAGTLSYNRLVDSDFNIGK